MPKRPEEDDAKAKMEPHRRHPAHEISYERAAYLGLALPSRSVALVRSGSNRSARLPTPCDVCQRMIDTYPFIAKEGSGYRKYHISCALRIGLILTKLPGS